MTDSAPPRPPAHPPDGALAALLDRLAAGREGSFETAIPGLILNRICAPDGPRHGIQAAALLVIAQGAKQLLVGDRAYAYDPGHYMVCSVDLPVVAHITAASGGQPYLGLRMNLDVETIDALMRDAQLPPDAGFDGGHGMYVNPLGADLRDAVVRLLRLLETPADIPILAPMIRREIVYRLLMAGQGARLRQMALQDSQTQRIACAIRLLQARFAQPLRMDDIARDVHMSVSSLHHHFKAVTAMSPLQYQKQLRLQEARKLMFVDEVDVATAAQRVGYESPSQFSREYRRLFGEPPLRDRQRWLSKRAAPGGVLSPARP